MSGVYMLVVLLLVGIVARSNLISSAACILLVLKFSSLDMFFPFLEKRGLEIGLLFLLLSILVPVATEKITKNEILYSFLSLPGILAILGGALATYLNGDGLKLLQIDPEIIFGVVIGSIIGITFFGGIPVGPLMAAGLTALFLNIIGLFRH
ncbi:MAG TPA: DUF441 domain-containing protein [Desulfotomaculum sp.]|nr:MAG: hypothetical protein XD84_1611 [Desulfotomaculum sp. 46_80]HAG10176.1 DUF441 domain-containing protein [Desulfotomaculum sp.]HBY03072.1 DUF441 domain-containing protein [Desulfotomaculum sp.]